jgi:hypothetical protein
MTAFQTFTAGQILTAAQVTTLQANSTAIAIFRDEKTSGTNGGTGTAGAWTKRTLNTTAVNNIVACSIASSVITLTAGTYFVSGQAPFYRTSVSQIKLRNTTAGSDLVLGTTAFTNSAVAGGVVNSLLEGYFTLTGSTNIEMQYYIGSTQASNDLGQSSAFGTEVYATLTIQQVA